MRILIVLFVLLASACGSTPGTQPRSGQITNIQAPGNLEAGADVGCIAVESLKNTYTAADLYRINTKCVKEDHLDAAVYVSAMAGVYARYDSMRVADQSAHQAQTVLRMNFANSLTESEKKAFMARLSAVAGDPASLATLCARIRAIGPPNYHPTYMIQHGMGAFVGSGGNGLVSNFDSSSAWDKSLDAYLHCPKQ